MIDEKRLIQERVRIVGECWEWTGSISTNGYGQITYNRKAWKAHRLSYAAFSGTVPEGKEIDHLCRNRRCVNPQHLEAVSKKTNILRGISFSAENARKETCPAGHPLITFQKQARRDCRECRREASRRVKERAKASPRTDVCVTCGPTTYPHWMAGPQCGRCYARLRYRAKYAALPKEEA
jgi:hypothetical protein